MIDAVKNDDNAANAPEETQPETKDPTEDKMDDIAQGASKEEEGSASFEDPAKYAVDPVAATQKELIATSTPTTDLEIALKAELDRQMKLNGRLQSEISKLKNFVSKRKQAYKRKRKEDEAPKKSLSGYNMFVKERFAKLAIENQKALKSGDAKDQLTRIAPHKKVAEAGKAWRALSAEEKAKYEAMAKPDKDRYEEQMATYQAPEKGIRKRNKTGYNLFFSAHVLRMKTSDSGVPSERGCVARIVGDAWKKMSNEEKDFYEREADKQNDLLEKVGGDHTQPPHQMPGHERAPDLAAETLPPQTGGPPPHGYAMDRSEYMGHPPVIHPPNGGYFDSRYGPPPPGPYGGYDYYGYPPPGLGQSPNARGQPPHDPYAYGPPPPDYRGPPY